MAGGRQSKGFSERETRNAAHQLRVEYYPLFKAIKDQVGSNADVDAVTAMMLVKYSEQYSFRAAKGSGMVGMGSCGVRAERCSLRIV